jgi:hypothetical protein
MARPQKEGLNYFSLDVDMDQDDKVALVEAKHGIEGFGILIKLLMKIYKEGYFYHWTECEQLLFSRKLGIDTAVVIDVINDALKWGMFNQEIYEKHQILTSSGIQKRYIEAARRRKEIIMFEDYILINPDDYTKKYNISIILVSVNKNPLNDDKNQIDVNNSTQSKVKESKVKESKEKNKNTIVVPFEKIKESFNRVCVSFPKVLQLSQSRKDKLKVRWVELETLEKFEELFMVAENTPFLRGENKNKWRATFDWLIENDKNYLKVLEGQYNEARGPTEQRRKVVV